MVLMYYLALHYDGVRILGNNFLRPAAFLVMHLKWTASLLSKASYWNNFIQPLTNTLTNFVLNYKYNFQYN